MPIGSVSGVVTAYLVTLAVAMPASGWVGDRFGGRNVLLAAITLFTAASALCGVATSLPELVAFRALQGLGGGMLVPVGMTMITRVFPPAERIKANQVLIVPDAARPGARPGDRRRAGRRPVLAVDLLHQPAGRHGRDRGRRCCSCPRGSEHPAGRFDLPGLPARGRRVPAVHVRAVDRRDVRLGLARRCSAPALAGAGAARRLHRRRAAGRASRCCGCGSTATGCSASPACSSPPRRAAFMGTLFLVPLLLQNGLGFSAIHSGLSTFTEALGGMTGVQLTSRLYKRVGPRRLMIAGMGGACHHDRPDGPGRAVGRGLADPAADVLHRLLVRLRDVPVADRQHGHGLRGGDRARLHPAEHGPPGGRRRPASRCSARCSPRPGRARVDLAGYHLAFLAAAGADGRSALAFAASSTTRDAAPTMAAAKTARRSRPPGSRLTEGAWRPVTLTAWLLPTALPSPCP